MEANFYFRLISDTNVRDILRYPACGSLNIGPIAHIIHEKT